MSHLSCRPEQNDEVVMTTLPELLHNSASITTNEHPYMKIDIPPPPLEEPEHKTLPVGKVHTIPTANSPKPPKAKGQHSGRSQ